MNPVDTPILYKRRSSKIGDALKSPAIFSLGVSALLAADIPSSRDLMALPPPAEPLDGISIGPPAIQVEEITDGPSKIHKNQVDEEKHTVGHISN